jgi:DNA repair ATPase RecN
MLSSIEIHNYQSIHDMRLELGPFTVIVGQTDSGKSAFTRAVKLLTSNARGNSFISNGERFCTVSATTEQGTVTLKRGRVTTEDEYTVVPSAPDHPLAPQRTWTKLNASVPEQVSEFIGIEPKDPINYAGQFDKPYLLDNTGGDVARVLGALTNVNIIFEGARESNRRKLASSSTLKTRAGDLAAIREKLPTYAALKGQRAHLTAAEEKLEEATKLQRRIDALTHHIEIVTTASALTTRLEAVANIEIPDASELDPLNAALGVLKSRLRTISAARTETLDVAKRLDAITEEITTTQEEYEESLTKLSGAIATHFSEKSTTMEDFAEGGGSVVIEVWEAAQLSADYIVGVLK